MNPTSTLRQSLMVLTVAACTAAVPMPAHAQRRARLSADLQQRLSRGDQDIDVIVDGESIYLMELELIEPELYLDLAPGSAARLAECVHRDMKRRDMMRH